MYLIFGYGIPLIVALVPAITKSYDEIYFYCWIQGNIDEYYITLFYLIPLWLTVIYLVYTIFKVRDYLLKAGLMEEGLTFYRRIKFYPITLLVANGFSTVHRTLLLCKVDLPGILFILDNTLTNLQGFLNAIYYGLNYSVQKELKQCLSKKGSENN